MAAPPTQQLVRDMVDALDAALNTPVFMRKVNTLFTEQVAVALGDADARTLTARKERDLAYRDRARLLALLATQYPAWWAQDQATPGYQVLILELPVSPAGQVSFHIHERDLDLFTGPIASVVAPRGATYDGHSTREKWGRFYAVACMHANSRHAGPIGTLPPSWTKDAPSP